MRPVFVVVAFAAGLSACAARPPARPAGSGDAHPPAVEEFTTATKQCAGLKTVTAELRLSGRAAGEKIRGTLLTGLSAPASVRFEAVAPFGRPIFILAGRGDRATLLLPRDEQVLPDAPLADVLERLTGLRLGAVDLRMLLTGCLADAPSPDEGRRYDNGWRSVRLGPDTVAYLRDVNGRPIVVAADAGQWRVDYANVMNGWPRHVRLRSQSGDVDLTASIDQLEVNTALDDKAFEVDVPAGTATISLDHLRSVAPLRGTDEKSQWHR